jgi:hypothetical protein
MMYETINAKLSREEIVSANNNVTDNTINEGKKQVLSPDTS